MATLKSIDRFNQLVEEAVAQSFAGWDFSYLNDRMIQAEPSWNYHDLVAERMSKASAMLDLHTGGGEFLDFFAHLPAVTVATEGFAPNVSLARERLAKRDVEVVAVSSEDSLPLQSNAFDLVISRHGAYGPKELHRIMRGGKSLFLTQQVGSENLLDLNAVLRAAPVDNDHWNLSTATEQLVRHGFAIVRAKEEALVTSFKDIGAVVFYLLAVPWQIPDFSVTKYHAELRSLHQHIETTASFDLSAHRFLIEAEVE